jgi:hypothetical protein
MQLIEELAGTWGFRYFDISHLSKSKPSNYKPRLWNLGKYSWSAELPTLEVIEERSNNSPRGVQLASQVSFTFFLS